MESTHTHPNPTLDKLTQYGALAVLVIIVLAVPLQLVLAVVGAPFFVLTALFTLLFAPFILLLMTTTPALSLSANGLTLQPRIWKTRFIPWDAVTAVKPYPLLPPADAEVTRKALAGRKKYRPAEGVMLVIPALPLPYRFGGFFAGEGFTPVIAVTTRTHTDYDDLIRQIRQHTKAAQHA